MGNSQKSYYQDYTNSGINHFEETDIYRKAISIGDRRVVEDNRPEPPQYDRTTMRTVEVPFTRQVRVPTTETKIVPSTTRMTVPVKKMVEVPSYRIVDEEYVDWEEREAVRDKEIWVKQTVQEKYIEKVPITRIRQVRVPHKDIQEVEELEEVEVPTTKAVSVPSFRVDEVQDSKLVEVEEKEKMAWHANPTGEHKLQKTTEGDLVDGPHYSRKVGREFYARGDPHISHLPVDNQRSSEYKNEQIHARNNNYHSHTPHPHLVDREAQRRYTEGPYSSTGTMQRTRPMSASFYRKHDMQTTQQIPYPRTLNPQQPMEPTEEPRTSNGSYGWETSYSSSNAGVTNGWVGNQQPNGAYNQSHRGGGSRGGSARPNNRGGIGMTVKTTATAHTDSYGVVVTKVAKSSVAANSGLRENDIVVSCQGRPTTTIEELGTAIQSASGGAIHMQVNRDGKRDVQIVVYRD